MPVHNAPLSVALFEYCGTQPAAFDVAHLSCLPDIRRDRVLESCPSRFAREVNFDIAERILRVLHLAHFRAKMMVAIIRPALVGMSTLKDRQRFIIGPDLRS